MPGQKIKPFLWYDTQAEEAARLYVSLFKDSSIDKIIPGPSGAHDEPSQRAMLFAVTPPAVENWPPDNIEDLAKKYEDQI